MRKEKHWNFLNVILLYLTKLSTLEVLRFFVF